MIPGANIRHSSIRTEYGRSLSSAKRFVETSSRSGKYLHKSDVILNEKTK